MSIQHWEHFFKPEVRSSGRSLFKEGKVSINQPSDTEIIGYIRVSSPLKVSLKSKSISASLLSVDCNCPAGKKGLFCKHIWAVLLATDAKNPDFFESKTEIEKVEASPKEEFKVKPSAASLEYEEARAKAQEAYKEKQAAFRKEQYEKQKQRLKDLKKDQKNKKTKIKEEPEVVFPRDVEKALVFFSENGFELREVLQSNLNKDVLSSAKKKLARIFHPDLGGSHDEILELNKHSDVLMAFISKSN